MFATNTFMVSNLKVVLQNCFTVVKRDILQIQLYILNGGEPLEATRNCETKSHDYKRKDVLLGDRNGVRVTSALSLSLPVCH